MPTRLIKDSSVELLFLYLSAAKKLKVVMNILNICFVFIGSSNTFFALIWIYCLLDLLSFCN